MATYNRNELLEQLKAEVNTVLATVQQISNDLDAQSLNRQPMAGKWSIAQVLEHLNTYNRYYLPAIKAAMPKAGHTTSKEFKSGWLGEYFAKSMYSEVVTGKRVANKMSAMKGHIPDASLNAAAVINEFIAAEKELLQMLEDAKQVNIGGIRIPITISKMIKIKVGDALRFLVAHQVRHLLQINNTRSAISR